MVVKKRLQAFTLIELLVAVAIFSVAVGISAEAFVNVSRMLKRAEVVYNLQQDSRFVLEKLAQEMRVGTIDYSQQTVFRGAASLYLLNSSNESVNFVWQNNKLYLAKAGQFGLTNITPQNLKIVNLGFFVAPEQDPLNMASPMQPRVTLMMKTIQADTEKLAEQAVELNIQTTVSSRVYRQ